MGHVPVCDRVGVPGVVKFLSNRCWAGRCSRLLSDIERTKRGALNKGREGGGIEQTVFNATLKCPLCPGRIPEGFASTKQDDRCIASFKKKKDSWLFGLASLIVYLFVCFLNAQPLFNILPFYHHHHQTRFTFMPSSARSSPAWSLPSTPL